MLSGSAKVAIAAAGPKSTSSKTKAQSVVKAATSGTTVPLRIADAWKQLEKTLTKVNPEIRKSLARKATDKQIKALREDVKHTVPEDLIDSLQIHNGQVDAAPCLIPGEWTQHEYQLISVDSILRERRVWQELVDAGEFRGQTANSDPGVRSVWFSLDWIIDSVRLAGIRCALGLSWRQPMRYSIKKLLIIAPATAHCTKPHCTTSDLGGRR
jgi:hypothetical protein